MTVISRNLSCSRKLVKPQGLTQQAWRGPCSRRPVRQVHGPQVECQVAGLSYL